MRWGIVFAIALTAAIAGWMAVQYHWAPPFVPQWDSRAHLEFALASGVIALISGVGLASQTPWQHLPRRLRFVPVSLGLFVPLFLFLGILDLSPAAPLTEAVVVLLPYGIFGFVVAAVIGVSSGMGKPTAEEDAAAQRSPTTVARYLFLLLAAAFVVGSVVLLTPRARDDIRIEPFESFSHSDTQLTAGLSKGAWQDDAFAMIKITDHGKTNSLVMERSEWRSLIEAWNKAKRASSAKWSLAAAVADTTPADPCRMEFWAGPGVRLVIMSPQGPTVRFQLAPNEVERFGRALLRIQQNLRD